MDRSSMARVFRIIPAERDLPGYPSLLKEMPNYAEAPGTDVPRGAGHARPRDTNPLIGDGTP
ncbi:hypothetical protein ASZ90_015090 [hydrocarbon metagenome]|uniref:Uncharacterized protein n=1 Tax=hydrocarbon metagenome TaxID=938273 RepID=A0A0W8F2Z2_9ZZZZ